MRVTKAAIAKKTRARGEERFDAEERLLVVDVVAAAEVVVDPVFEVVLADADLVSCYSSLLW